MDVGCWKEKGLAGLGEQRQNEAKNQTSSLGVSWVLYGVVVLVTDTGARKMALPGERETLCFDGTVLGGHWAIIFTDLESKRAIEGD